MSEISYVGGVPEFIFDGQERIEEPIYGKSGQLLLVNTKHDSIAIESDQMIGDFEPHFQSSVRGLPEGLTMSSSVETVNRFTDERLHPDLYASLLFDRTLQYFEEHNGRIQRFEDTWTDDSYNFLAFRAALDKQPPENDVVERAAAFSTWTGKLMLKHGFTELEELAYEQADGGLLVLPMFRRP